MSDINIRIAGEAGQGVQTTGDLLMAVLTRLGIHAFSVQSYMSRIRGGLNWYDIRVADFELFAGRQKADLLLALTPVAVELLRQEMTDTGLILFDGAEQEAVVAIDFRRAAREAGGTDIMANTVATATICAILGLDGEVLNEHLRQAFIAKGADVVEANLRCAARGVELAGSRTGLFVSPRKGSAPDTHYSGAEAMGLGMAVAGVKFATAYPMSPSTATLTYLAGAADRYGMVVEQAEDEIAAANMVCGAAYAGVPAVTVTSGGGFALMVEALSLAGMLELPLVILLAQRPGPATGLPTRTAQGDLAFALHAGHGEFVRALYAPGTQQESYSLARRALETAHRCQTPVLILTDQFLQDSRKNIPPLDDRVQPIDRCVISGGPEYQRYAMSADGVSPRAVPGGEALVVCDSDEHDADGHITENLDVHLEQHDKRMRKLALLEAQALPPTWYGPAEAPTVLVTWGSTYGPAREAVDQLGGRAAMMHFSQVWPVNVAAGRALLDRRHRERVISVEGNSTGQFASILRTVGLLGACDLLLRYDGLPFTAEYIVARVQR